MENLHEQKSKKFNTPVDLVVKNATIISCDTYQTIIENGTLAVDKGLIVYIGPLEETLESTACEVIDARGRIVMPGLINTHCHAGDSLFRGLVEGLPLEPWLEKLWIVESAILTPETIELGALLGLGENLLNGVTTVLDMFWEPASAVIAAKKLGMRIATGGLFFDPPGMDGATANQREGLAQDFFDAHKDEETLIPCVCVHGAYTVGPQSLATAIKVQQKHNTLITIHAAETQAEQKTIFDQYGQSVIQHLYNCDLLSPKAILAHCVHLDDAEIKILAQTGAHVSHNPASNLKLGSGIARIPDLLKAGVSIALGTDGAVSGNDLDMWRAIRLAATLHNGNTQNALAIGAQEALAMATLEGAKALGIEDHAGSLELNKRADFIILNPNKIHAVPIFDPINYLSYAASNGDVEDVFVGGRQVVRGRKIIGIDVQDLLEKVHHLTPNIRNTLSQQT